jgi:hypothetical protein
VKTKLMVGVAMLALALVESAAADTTGDVLTMHPVSHGALSNANWLALEGRPDSQGQANQGFVLEASGTPDTSAAALFRGFEGIRVSDPQSLSYQHRAGSTCTKTDPRWTLFIRGRGAKTYLINLGCAVTPARPTYDPKWIERVFTQAVVRLRSSGKFRASRHRGTRSVARSATWRSWPIDRREPCISTTSPFAP